MVKVAAVQLPFAWAVSPQEYFDRMHEPLARAAELGAQLAVLPQHCGDMLIGVQVPVDPTSSVQDVVEAGGFSSWAMCVRRTAATTAQFFVHTFETLALRHGLYLVPGTLSLPGEDPTSPFLSDEVVFRAAFLFAPDGQVLGEQRQTHRALGESDEMGYGDTLDVFTTDAGRLGLLVGADVFQPEVSRFLALQGANLLVHPAAERRASAGYQLRGVWREAQANHVFAIDARLAGGGYRGRAAIYAPLALTPAHTGILAQAEVDDDVAVVCADLDFDALRATRAFSSLMNLNQAFIAADLSEVFVPKRVAAKGTYSGRAPEA